MAHYSDRLWALWKDDEHLPLMEEFPVCSSFVPSFELCLCMVERSDCTAYVQGSALPNLTRGADVCGSLQDVWT